ncbi:MAG: 50S ribosomal protein L11 methyltransferase [Lachnospiraceae bacterium]|nr:50S ribosomal protein L11 methyltransferase [Lachnospiraceae bacterium]
MQWDSYTIHTTTVAEDFIVAMLDDLGIEGVQIENHVPLTPEEIGEMFIDFPADLGEDDGTSDMTFFIETGKLSIEEKEELLRKVMLGLEETRQFVDIGEGSITAGQTEDIDWVNNWKKFFSSFTIDNILIKPTWEDVAVEDTDKILIEIDPGISFGTGKHETTQLCIKGLSKYLKKGDAVLDAGCGSGILSIAALKLGAGKVVGTDIDEACIGSTKENLAVNKLDSADTEFFCGNLIDDAKLRKTVGEGCYDVVCANILADVIMPMAPALYNALKPGGVLISSGIIDFKEKQTAKTLEEQGFTIKEINHMGEWVGIIAEK